ncbi:MAG: L-histidine N(alpha)-methyltransferase, partial [Methyloligellaceae bacterium]
MTLPADVEQAESLSGEFAEAVVAGLSQRHKHIPCRFLYDARGSALFEEITRLDEYYPTRTELGLLNAHGSEIASRAGTGCAVVEFGSGSSRKTHILLEHMDKAAAYVPVDIDSEALTKASARLKARFPELPVHPVHADFSQHIDLPREIENAPKLGFFPGSTIGNFETEAAVEFLANAGELLGAGSDLLIGADLQKDLDILLPAYDDAKGVTADFTLNLCHRINRELEGDLDMTQFAHAAIYNDEIGRIEIYIESLIDQEAEILGHRFSLRKGERVHVENSHKYTVPQFHDLVREAGWRPEQVWTDGDCLFSLHYLTRAESA